MSRAINMPRRRYELSEQDAETAVAALVLLAQGLNGGTVQVSLSDNGELPPAVMPAAVLPALIDLLSLLVSKGTGVLVVDSADEVLNSEQGQRIEPSKSPQSAAGTRVWQTSRAKERMQGRSRPEELS